jgi:hypothetical protein
VAVVPAVAATRAVSRPRSSIAVLHLIGAVASLPGIALVGSAPAFLDHGPAVRGAPMALTGPARGVRTGLYGQHQPAETGILSCASFGVKVTRSDQEEVPTKQARLPTR